MPSTAISEIAYEPETRTLSVRFRDSGAAYDYLDVPPELHEALRRASARGRFFNQYIRDSFVFRRSELSLNRRRHSRPFARPFASRTSH